MIKADRASDSGAPVARGRRYQPLVPILAAFCAGITADRLLEIERFGQTAEFIGLSSGLLLIAWWWFWKRGRLAVSQWFLLAAITALGGTWHHACWHLFSPYDLGLYADAVPGPVVFEGTALGPPRQLPAPPPSPLRSYQLGDRSRVDVHVTAIRDGNQWRRADGRTTILVDGHLLGITSGDRLRIVGQISRPMPARNPGDFDFADFARGQRRLSFVRASYPDCVIRLTHSTAGAFGASAAQIRAWGNQILWQCLSQPQSGMAAAVLLGARERLSNDRTEPFVTTGTIHLLVISGLHLGILAGLFLLMMRIGLLPRRTALILVALLVVGYAMLTEARPPVVRASVLVVVMSIAGLMGRRALAFNSLAAAALVVLAMNPSDLFRTGSQLSFLAVAALAWLGSRTGWHLPWDGPHAPDPLDRLIAQTRPWTQRAARHLVAFFGKLFLATFVVWLVVAPLVMARFHLLTPVTLLLGPVVWLPLAVSLLAGFAVLGFGLLFPPLCGPCAIVCNASLAILEGCVTWADRLPGSHFWVSGPSDWWLVGLYGGLAATVAMPGLFARRYHFPIALTAWTVIGVATATGDRQGSFQCTFLSVGHGCAVVLELPTGETVLYDAGCLGSPLSAARSVAGYLWTQGVPR
ncbi:MAG: ComEC/Rec2 family competence protein, partial [Pirellulales bacterium]